MKEALLGCVRRRVKSAIIFSAGFAEIGEREAQDELSRIARAGNVSLLGPNCLGYTNYIDGIAIGFTGASKVPVIDSDRDPAVAIVSQSGGLAGHIRQALAARDVLTSYYVSTGNEADLGLAEFIDFFAQDEKTKAIIVYVEEFRRPDSFIAAAAESPRRGKAGPVAVAGSKRQGQGGGLIAYRSARRRLCGDANHRHTLWNRTGRYAGRGGRYSGDIGALSKSAGAGAGRHDLLGRVLRIGV